VPAARRCRQRRQGRFLWRRQFPDDEFAFDLEADDEEEQRHQEIVDPMLETAQSSTRRR
jgi:hypothetical protein